MKWRDDFVSKISQINKYKMFQDTDNAFDTRPPNKNKMICVHIVFDFKHDKQHNVQLKADGHLTNMPHRSVCMVVVSLRHTKWMKDVGYGCSSSVLL
jgi:hypothetical protein